MRSTDLLRIVDRCGLVTVDLATAAIGCTENAVIKQLGRLVKSGQLGCWPLYDGRKYWARRKLGPQALARTHALASYFLGDASAAEAGAGARFVPIACNGEALRSLAGGQIEAVRADLGGDAGHVVRKARRFLRLNEGRDLSNLTYVILTYSPEKSRAIVRSLQLHAFPFKLKVVVIGELFHLITRRERCPGGPIMPRSETA